MDIKDLRIAVIGGGYGGASAAKALQAAGAQQVHVFEQAPAIFQVGAGIGLRPFTIKFFEDWGAGDAIKAVSSPSEYLEIYTADGQHLLAREEWPHIHDYDPPIPTRIIHRGDFIDALLGVLPPETVHIGHKLTSVHDHGDRVDLAFENGATFEADLVIGADGIRSTVRHQLISEKEPVWAGEHAYRVVVDEDRAHGLLTDSNPRFYFAHNGVKVYNLPMPHRKQLSFDVTAPSDDDSWAPIISSEYLVGLLEGFDARIIQTARDLNIAEVTSRSVYDIDILDTWHTDSVTLLGDAAHAMLHHLGQGANSAIQDAGALPAVLLEAESVEEALIAFEAARKPVTDELQRLSRQSWDPNAVDSAFPDDPHVRR